MRHSPLLDVLNDPAKGFTQDIWIDESVVTYIRFLLFCTGESSYISAVRGQTQRKVDGTFMVRLPHEGRWLNASLLTCDSPMGIFDLVIGPKTAPTTDSSWIGTRDSSHRIENLDHGHVTLAIYFFWLIVSLLLYSLLLACFHHGFYAIRGRIDVWGGRCDGAAYRSTFFRTMSFFLW